MMAKEKRLKFVKVLKILEVFEIYNSKDEFLGLIRKERVGAHIHWCHVITKEMFFDSLGNLLPNVDYFSFSAGCQDEMREFCKNPETYAKKYPEVCS